MPMNVSNPLPDAVSSRGLAMRNSGGHLIIAAALALAACSHLAHAAAVKGPDAVCYDPALSRQEQTLCVEQIRTAQTVAEQKKVQAKYRDRIAAKNKQK
jgi:hypothetical protein